MTRFDLSQREYDNQSDDAGWAEQEWLEEAIDTALTAEDPMQAFEAYRPGHSGLHTGPHAGLHAGLHAGPRSVRAHAEALERFYAAREVLICRMSDEQRAERWLKAG